MVNHEANRVANAEATRRVQALIVDLNQSGGQFPQTSNTHTDTSVSAAIYVVTDKLTK